MMKHLKTSVLLSVALFAVFSSAILVKQRLFAQQALAHHPLQRIEHRTVIDRVRVNRVIIDPPAGSGGSGSGASYSSGYSSSPDSSSVSSSTTAPAPTYSAPTPAPAPSTSSSS